MVNTPPTDFWCKSDFIKSHSKHHPLIFSLEFIEQIPEGFEAIIGEPMPLKKVKFVIGGQLIKNRKPERIDKICFLNEFNSADVHFFLFIINNLQPF